MSLMLKVNIFICFSCRASVSDLLFLFSSLIEELKLRNILILVGPRVNSQY